MARTPDWMRSAGAAETPPEIRARSPHPARVWDYWLGGKDNFAADRETAELLLDVLPQWGDLARADREFLIRVVRFFMTDARLHQIVDIGAGIPTSPNVHEVAQAIRSTAQVCYVDNDPLVLAHARALLRGGTQGRVDCVQADLRSPRSLMESAGVDRTQPVGLTLLAVLEFLPDQQEARSALLRLTEAVPSGSYVAVAHPLRSPAMDEALRRWNLRSTVPARARTEAEITELLSGMDILEPGLVPLPEWRPAPDTQYRGRDLPFVGVVARTR
ncbi:SAM-dependent methyltransferase [Lipingzhangella sp. LS1_29]|uniref:SAM-dependent methyltransferase n=1 Tax=Lipingzhangella rawalii TaxID=2055835 RepID=A0ABU2H0F2_9ACTN|nr:SAM-dependent methyltransferase [Lipingzhangella rawalii]MDS1268784.1 SAM-dependent methyltransferase [Lipingzhangella rawalii]